MKTTHSNTLNALPMLNYSPTSVTNQDLDESTDSDYESVEPEEEDTYFSEEGQKVTAVRAIIDTATGHQASRHEHSKRCRRSSKLLFTKKIRVLLDSGSDGGIWFHQKGATKCFPYTEKQMAKSYHTSAGIF